MEETEELKRQIEHLQNLIDKHKSTHGDIPFARVEQRQPGSPTIARSHSTSVLQPHSFRGRLYAHQNHGSWRKTYSLRNKNPQYAVGHPSPSTSSLVHHSSLHSLSHSTSLPSTSKGGESDRIKSLTLSSRISQQKSEGQINSIAKAVATENKNTDSVKKTGRVVSQHQDGKGGSSSTGTSMQHEMLHRKTHKFQQRAESRGVVLPEKTVSGSPEKPSSAKVNTSTVQTKSSLPSETSTESKKTVTTPAILKATKTEQSPSALLKGLKQPSIKPTPHTSKGQVNPSFLKKSKFTWVKSQDMGQVEPKQASISSSAKGNAVNFTPSISEFDITGESSSLSSVTKRTPVKKLPRKLSPVTVASKISKYKWVSSSAGAQAKISRKSLSPKALTLSQRTLEKGAAIKKLRVAPAPSAKIKKGIPAFSVTSPLSSRYRWKAGGPGTSTAVTGAATVARRKSAFHWTSEKSNKVGKGAFIGSLTVTQQTSTTSPSSSFGGFKLRSSMKIIRKSTSSEDGSERRTSPTVKYSLRGRTQSLDRRPMGVKRTPSRELVSFGRHKLRRLSPTFSRTSLASTFHRGPASQRVLRTHHKMVTHPSSSAIHTPYYNPALSWRAKRIQSARTFLQSRLRAPHDRHLSSTQRWRGSSMCWIGGSLYRVSANKLSRTMASSMSINRTGRSFSAAQVSSMTPAFNRPSSTRHLASRAVQRSLAIIRNARQKKQPKQYCMYYNRFGKCNRGNSCPYIHDPDKVAVCTRFLRGTCKQADGTCPFSHKVAKEKMPVCSYFLKGICNNSDCPYSHVYVSRKAEVCENFVKGYCPDGEKCKKKHTLVCPDFSKMGSCPRGSRCKLQHRQRAKRSTSSTSNTPAKKARPREPSKRLRLTVTIPQGSQAAPETPAKGPLALPSFISLSSSPEEAEAPDKLLTETSKVKEKKLQIKPRL